MNSLAGCPAAIAPPAPPPALLQVDCMCTASPAASLLAVPVLNDEGTVVAVLRVSNKRGGSGSFSRQVMHAA